MNRQIMLDTETTGLSWEKGHRVIEIGCIEVVNRRVTDQQFHVYINPEREIDPGAQAVHGISMDFLEDKPVFAEVIEEFIAFIKGAELVIHNAKFDVGFLNHELKLHGGYGRLEDHSTIADTLMMARRKHPGQRNSLDALCKRYAVDASERTLHGALLDSQLLAEVYLAMTGGQESFVKLMESKRPQEQAQKLHNKVIEVYRQRASDQELEAHQAYCEMMAESAGQHYWQED